LQWFEKGSGGRIECLRLVDEMEVAGKGKVGRPRKFGYSEEGFGSIWSG